MTSRGQREVDRGHHTIEIEASTVFYDAKSDLYESDNSYQDERQPEGDQRQQQQQQVSSNHETREIVQEHIIDTNKVLFVDSINSKVRRAFPSLVSGKHTCIYRVHKKFRLISDRAYTPEVVSIGPLHREHREGDLKAMEECKLLYIFSLLSRIAKAKFKDSVEITEKTEGAPVENKKDKEVFAHTNSEPPTTEPSFWFKIRKKTIGASSSSSTKLESAESMRPIRRIKEAVLAARKGNPDLKTTGWLTILEECGESIKKIEKTARKCYSETIKLNTNEFVEMMLIDGLFLIELFRRGAGELAKAKYDPIFGQIGSLSSLTGDLLLLENQLPMIVLDCLFKVPALQNELQGSSLNLLILKFFNYLMPRDATVLETFSNNDANHLLDLLAHTFYPSDQSAHRRNDSRKSVPSATELKRSGVRFEKGSTSTTGSFLDIEFDDGVLKIPPIIVQYKTELLFRNLIASEQCSDGDVTYMTSYAFFMDSLIDSAHDVELLRSVGIITNYLGSDEDVSNLFNKLCCEVIINNFYYSQICDQLIKHYSTRWYQWRATLMRDYFHNPWAIISFIAALLLIAVTSTATLLAFLSFFIHKS